MLGAEIRLTLMPVTSLGDTLRTFSVAVVTGGSSGIGKSFIGLVQKLNPELVICNLSRRSPVTNISGRDAEKLNHFPCDLSRPDEVARVGAEVSAFLRRRAGTGRILLINNSGFGSFGRFPEPALEQELAMIDLNVRALVQLTGLLLPQLRERGGAVLNVASTVAFMPMPYAATYAATKAFVLHWTLALNEELRGSGVHALAVCPGTTRTEFFDRAGVGEKGMVPALTMTSDEVAELGLRALAAGRSQIVTGWKNKLYTAIGSKLPKPWVARVTGKVLGRLRLGRSDA